MGIHAYAVMPPPENEIGKTDSAAVSLPKCAASFVLSASMPPTARTENTARTITAVILITNCTRSVHKTAHMPAATEYATVMTKQMPTAAYGFTPSEIVRILIIARVTQPRMIRLTPTPRYSARNPRRNDAGRPAYRISANSMSVITLARRQSRAKKNTVSIPLIAKHHHSQLPATPFAATMPVTTSGVSAAKVVATIDAPASHHGTARPERKYSLRLSPPFFVNAKPIAAERRKYAATIAQSMMVNAISSGLRWQTG